MLHLLLLAAAIVCAIEAIRVKRLLVSALWLAGTSAIVSLLIFMMGAPQVAVIELSVGAGLVTVLFVFAINIAGEENLDNRPVIPAPVAWLMVGVSLLLLAWLNLPNLNLPLTIPNASQFTHIFWEDRGLDILIQIALIFCGVLGVLGLLSTPRQSERGS